MYCASRETAKNRGERFFAVPPLLNGKEAVDIEPLIEVCKLNENSTAIYRFECQNQPLQVA
jgi:hypothetical protein